MDAARCANVTLHGSGLWRAPRGSRRSSLYPRTVCGSLRVRVRMRACVHERPCVYDAIMRARYFPATTAKLPAIDNYANYAIKLFIQAVPDPRREATIEIT